jgi:hypothetical protein
LARSAKVTAGIDTVDPATSFGPDALGLAQM